MFSYIIDSENKIHIINPDGIEVDIIGPWSEYSGAYVWISTQIDIINEHGVYPIPEKD